MTVRPATAEEIAEGETELERRRMEFARWVEEELVKGDECVSKGSGRGGVGRGRKREFWWNGDGWED